MLPVHRRALWPSHAAPRGPETSEGKQGAVLAEGEPLRRLARPRVGVLAKRGCRHDAAVVFAEPAAPVRAANIANIGDRNPSKLRRTGHPPARHDKLTLAIHSVADNRRKLVGENSGEHRQVARTIVARAKPVADRGLAFGQTVEIAHG